LGFYDLRVPETRAAQALMAEQHRVDAFCYYHYWFDGRRILERPFNEVLASGEPKLPFCLCWANDSWTGVWHGSNRVLIQQTYPGLDDHARHFDWLAAAFSDPRYLKVDGKPIFLVFKPMDIPELGRTLEFWRRRAQMNGFPDLHLIGIRHLHDLDEFPRSGFDGSTTSAVPPAPRHYGRWIDRPELIRFNHADVVERMIAPFDREVLDYPCIGPSWDNSPRAGRRGIVVHGSTPELFRRNLQEALSRTIYLPSGQKLIFIKAWNEWAEGNHLEPDLRFGRAWLEAVRDEVNEFLERARTSKVSARQ